MFTKMLTCTVDSVVRILNVNNIQMCEIKDQGCKVMNLIATECLCTHLMTW